MVEIRKIGEALGAEVTGIDLSRPIAPELFARIRAAWLEHMVLRWRCQSLTARSCTLHRRDAFDPAARRLLHRTQVRA